MCWKNEQTYSATYDFMIKRDQPSMVQSLERKTKPFNNSINDVGPTPKKSPRFYVKVCPNKRTNPSMQNN